MKRDTLKKLVNIVSEKNKRYENKYKSFERFWTELTNDNNKFTEYLLDDVEHTRQVNSEIFYHLIDNKNNNYEYSPKLLATEIKGHILRIESLSNFFTIIISILGIYFSLTTSDLFQAIITAIWLMLVATIKWNVDRHLINQKQLINHLESYPNCNKKTKTNN